MALIQPYESFKSGYGGQRMAEARDVRHEKDMMCCHWLKDGESRVAKRAGGV